MAHTAPVPRAAAAAARRRGHRSGSFLRRLQPRGPRTRRRVKPRRAAISAWREVRPLSQLRQRDCSYLRPSVAAMV